MSSNVVTYGGAESRDPSALPCTGIRCTIDVVQDTSLSGSNLIAPWVSLELSNGYWAQIGYYETAGGAVEGFYQIWNLASNPESVIGGGTWSIVGGFGSHEFTIVWTGTGTEWHFMMDTTLVGIYDLGTAISAGTSASQPFEALVEQQTQGGPTFSVPIVAFSVTFQSQQGGTWHDVATATAYENGSYGVQGRDQNGSLAADQTLVGSAIARVSSGTTLWTAEPAVDTLVTITAIRA